MAFFTHHESPWERFYQGAYWILRWFNFWRVKQKWFLPKQRRNRFQVNLQQFEIELVPYSLLTCILLEVECTCFDLIGVDDMEPATIQTRKPLLELGTTTKKNIHENRQCLFSFSWELQTSLSHWSIIYFLCVFFLLILIVESESVKHREFSWFMSSWWLRLYPETQTLQWICGWGFLKGTLRWIPSTILRVQSLRGQKFLPVCFLMLPCRLNSDTGKKAGIPANKAHVGMVEGPKTIPSQHRDLAGFLKDDSWIH